MKQILLINKSGLGEAFATALRDEGYNVVSFFEKPVRPFAKTVFHKVKNLLLRLSGDKSYYIRQEQKTFRKQVIARSRALRQKFDVALFFRADLYPEKMIENIRGVSNLMVSYQYDGMAVCSKILNYQQYFDRIFVFDPLDYQKYKGEGFLPLTNCWFPDSGAATQKVYDFFYVGVGIDERQAHTLRFNAHIRDRYKMKAILTIPPFREEKVVDGVSFMHQGLSYSQNIDFLKKSAAVLDFRLDHHQGLSFRFFEAMLYEKKIITNNASVRDYDFYRPQNIFITDYEDLHGLEAFMREPYLPIDKALRDKYGFANWIRYVLDAAPYQKIELPPASI